MKSGPTDGGQEQRDQGQPAPGAAQKETLKVFPAAGGDPGMPGAVIGAAAGALVKRGRGQVGVASYALQGGGTSIRQDYSIPC
jgi:hypothetical protein